MAFHIIPAQEASDQGCLRTPPASPVAQVIAAARALGSSTLDWARAACGL